MPGPGPHMMYAMGSGLALTSLTDGRFSPHHTLTYALNAFFGPDIGSFSEWLGSTLGFGKTFASALADAVHHPFYYVLILGLPLCFLYSWVSRFLIQKGVLDSVSGVPLTKKQCLLLISAGKWTFHYVYLGIEHWLVGEPSTYQPRCRCNSWFLMHLLDWRLFLHQQSEALKVQKNTIISINDTYTDHSKPILLMVCKPNILGKSSSAGSW
ncbi:uncharacterized protein LOC122281882 isoform X3 [Carya illinoinensis]|uniref:uncharacterized protein LOC122281882 isoform X3 n=1 Tax=Carya illinoinensis TaxID=32201 RepID=UPI001C7274CF|nr:uncharacterized protein LOC122281882 isoform X3 [Carya illinoinensis]